MMLQLAQCHPTRCFTSQTCNVQTQRARLQTWMCSGNRPEGGSGAKVASDAQRRALLFGLTAGLVAGNAKAEQTSDNTPRVGEVQHTEEEWRKILSPQSYKILRQAGTERPRSSPLNLEKRQGTFQCAGCGAPLFQSQAKFESGTGWPSFTEAVDGSVVELPDYSLPFFPPRTEVRCKRCGGHIGHVFPDGPPPTGQRYCMNGAALQFQPAFA